MTPEQEKEMGKDIEEIKGQTAHMLAVELATIAYMELSFHSKGISTDMNNFDVWGSLDTVKKKFEQKIKDKLA